MIAAADEWLAKNAELIAGLEEFKRELDSIPDAKTVTVTVNYVTRGDIPSTVQGATQVVHQTVVPGEGGGTAGGFPKGMDVGAMQAAAAAMRNEMAAAQAAAAANQAEALSESEVSRNALDQTAITLVSIDATLAAARAAGITAQANRVLAGDYGTTAGATKATADATAAGIPLWTAGAGAFGILGGKVALFGGAIPGVLGHVSALHLIFDAAIEATIAFGGALLALSVGVVAVSPAVTDIKDHLTSVYDVSHALGQSIPPITGQFTQLAHALAPQVLVIYGAALNTIQRQTGVLGTAAHNVVNIFEDWAVKFQLWAASQNNLGKILASGTGFLSQFGQILGNVGAAISNLVKADPGTAHFLLDFFVGVTRVFDAITKLPAPILYAALAFHSIWLWGGLAANGLIGLLTPLKAVSLALGGLTATKIDPNASGLEKLKTTVTDIGLGFASLGKNIATWVRGIGTAMKDAEGFTATAAAGMNAAFGPLLVTLKGLAANPVTWIVALAVGLGALVYSATQADGATKGLISTINNGLSSMSASQAIFGGLNSDFTQLHSQLNQVNQAWAASTPGWSKLGGSISGALGAAKHSVDDLLHSFGLIGPTANPALNAITAEVVHLTTAQDSLFKTVGYTMKANSVTFEQSVALMDLAGVKASDQLGVMKTKVDDLVKGYQNMGVQGPLLASAVNAITFATTLADSKVSAITQGFSQFIQVLTGGESTMLTFATGLLGLSNAASGAATTLTTTNGTTRLTTHELSQAAAQAGATGASMSGLGTSSIALRQAFEQQITTGTNAINSLYTLSAASASGKQGMAQITQAGRDYVATLLPFAQGNQAATVQLMGLSQVAGGPAYDATKSLAQNFQTLTHWVGNIQNPLQQVDGIITTMTTKAGVLAQDVLNLASAISQNLNTAMANAVFQANGGQTSFDNFATAVLNAHGNIDKMIPSAKGLYTALVKDLSGNMPAVESRFKSFAEYGLGLSQQAADALWADVNNKGIPALNNAGAAADSLNKKHLDPLQTMIDGVKSHTQSMAGEVGKNLPSAMSTAGTAADTFKGNKLSPLNTQTVNNNKSLQAYSDMLGSYYPGKTNTAGSASNTFKAGGLLPLMNQTNNNKNALSDYSVMLTGKYPAALGTAGGKSQQTAQSPMTILLNVLKDLDKWVQIMAGDFNTRWPHNESTNVKVSGSGGANVKSSVSGVPNGIVTVYGFAGGGVMPGYMPGHDTIHAMLSPGEGILTPQATKMVGGEQGIHAINSSAQHFAAGGVAMPNIFNWAGKTLQTATKAIDDTFASVIDASVAGVTKATQASMANAASALAAKYAGQGGSNQQNIALGSKMAGAYGWSGLQFLDLAALWTRESGWSSIAQNPSSGAAGIAQNISGFSGGYQRGNAAQQIAWGLAYIKGRYGSPAAAWAHEMAFNWYDQGGFLPPGLSLAMNGTGQPEKVTANAGGGGEAPIEIHLHGDLGMEGLFQNLKGSANRYQIRNSGTANGVWKPGQLGVRGSRTT